MMSQDFYLFVSYKVCIVNFALVCNGFIDFDIFFMGDGLSYGRWFKMVNLPKTSLFLIFFTLLASNIDASYSSYVVLWPYSTIGLPTDNTLGGIQSKTLHLFQAEIKSSTYTVSCACSYIAYC